MMKIVGKHYLKVTLKPVIDEVGYCTEPICMTHESAGVSGLFDRHSYSWQCDRNDSGEGVLEENLIKQ